MSSDFVSLLLDTAAAAYFPSKYQVFDKSERIPFDCGVDKV